MKRSYFISLVFFVLSIVLSTAQSTTVLLEGTVGKASVMMEISMDGKKLSADYFYKRFKKSIPLEGRYVDAKNIAFVYEHWGSKETFLLKDVGTASSISYSGTWQQETETENGTTVTGPLSVKLKPADISKIPVKNSFVKRFKLSEYDYSRLASIEIKQDSIQKLSAAVSVTWLRDTISAFQSFRINKNTTLKGIDSINIFLEDLQFSELLSFLDCMGSEYTTDVHDVYVRGNILSFALSNSYECGGAHPDFGVTGFTFNLETGKRMELTDFLYFGKTEADYKKGDSYKLGTEVMGPNIVKLLTKLYPEEMKKPADEDEVCDYSAEDVWDYTSWYLTEKGLYLYCYFYRAARCCDGAAFSTIPYKTLAKYKNPAVVLPMK